jgi:hypothetical protein
MLMEFHKQILVIRWLLTVVTGRGMDVLKFAGLSIMFMVDIALFGIRPNLARQATSNIP